MAIDFVSIDFETANEKRASVCAIALIFFEDCKIIRETKWLVSPPQRLNYFNPYNIQIHGITESDIKDKPEFNQLWREIYPLINHKIIVAHNAGFDISVLRQLIDTYDLEFPNIEFICTCLVARKTWDRQINYTLKNIGNYLGYTFNHHEPHDDARICGQILIDACKYHECNSITDLAKTIDLKKGVLRYNYYRPCRVSDPFQGLRKEKYETIDVNKYDCHDSGRKGILTGKSVVFTGTLISMTRQNAADKVVEHGGSVSNGINKATNLLVMGIQDFARFVDNKESRKTKRARELIDGGCDLEIIDENDFLRLIFQEKQEDEC